MRDGGAGGAAFSDTSGASTPAGVLRPAWATSEPNRRDYADVIGKLQAMKVLMEASFFEFATHVLVTHLALFNPPVDDFYTSLQRKDRRSAKKWKFLNDAGC